MKHSIGNYRPIPINPLDQSYSLLEDFVRLANYEKLIRSCKNINPEIYFK